MRILSIAAVGLTIATAAPALAADAPRSHRVAIQVDQNDPAVMNLALNNAGHVLEYYRGKGEDAEVEIVAYGPGLHMLRDDTSPVKDRLGALIEHGHIKFAACHNTQEAMAKREGHPIPLVSQATVVPSGVVELMELQEAGWSYVRP